MSGPSILEKPISFESYWYEGNEEIKLPKMVADFPSKDFLDVFSSRRSVKRLGECHIDALSYMLYYAVRPYRIGMDDYGVTVYRSAAPSAGGRHPIDVLVGLVENGKRSLFLYQPLNHSLKRLSVEEKLQREFYNDIEQTLYLGDSALLWFSIQYMRTASKYSDYMSLIWRDVGAQLCCLQQAAKYVGLDSCPIGYLAEDTFDAMMQSNLLMSGGGLIVGKSI